MIVLLHQNSYKYIFSVTVFATESDVIWSTINRGTQQQLNNIINQEVARGKLEFFH